MFRPAKKTPDTILVKSTDAAIPDGLTIDEKFVLEELLNLTQLISLKYGFKIILGNFDKRSDKVDIIFPDVEIEVPAVVVYIIRQVSETDFKKGETIQDIQLIKKNNGGYQLWGLKENTWGLTDIDEKALDTIKNQLMNKIIIVQPDSPEYEVFKIGHDSISIDRTEMVPEWQNAVQFLSTFSKDKVKTGFDAARFGSNLPIPYYASLSVSTIKMKDAIVGLNLLTTPTDVQVEEQHHARKYAAC